MFTEIEVIAFAVLSFCIGVGLTITISVVNEKKLKTFETLDNSKINLNKRVSPFIHVNESLMVEGGNSQKNESVNRLKDKIESFKQRNRFYQS